MFFLVDTKDQSIVACKTRGYCAKLAFKKITGQEVPKGADPVKLANEAMADGDRAMILNESEAFRMIGDSELNAALETAHQFANAIDNFYDK